MRVAPGRLDDKSQETVWRHFEGRAKGPADDLNMEDEKEKDVCCLDLELKQRGLGTQEVTS